MKVAQWAEIRRLSEIEGLSQRATARRLRCSHRTVKKALALTQPPDENRRAARGSILDPFKSKIDALLAKYPDLSAVRVLEEIAKEPEGYQGEISLVRQYLRQDRRQDGLAARRRPPGADLVPRKRTRRPPTMRLTWKRWSCRSGGDANSLRPRPCAPNARN